MINRPQTGVPMLAYLSLARRAAALLLLSVACYQDVRTREIDDKVWYAMAAVCVPLAVAEVAIGAADPVLYGLSVATGLAIAAALNYARLMGGADIKALALIAATEVPEPARCLLCTLPPVGVLTNTVLVSAAVPLAIALRNLAVYGGRLWEGLCPDEPLWKRLVALFVLVKVRVGEYRSKPHAYVLAEERGEGCSRLVFSISAPEEVVLPPSDMSDDEEVWASYLLPYIVLIAVGYLTYVTAGPLIEYLLRATVGL